MFVEALKQNKLFFSPFFIGNGKVVLNIAPLIPKYSDVVNNNIYVNYNGSMKFEFMLIKDKKYD